MNKETISEKIRKRIQKKQKWLLISGIALSLYGLIRFTFMSPNLGTNLKTQLPQVINGAEFIFIGIGLIVGWYLTKKNKEEIIDCEINEIEEEKEKRKKNYNLGSNIKNRHNLK